MKLRWRDLSLPLFARELREQANRRRTYVLRTVYALLLFGLAFVLFRQTLRGGTSFGILGQGREMFQTLVGLQLAGIYLFMPAIGCTAIAQEKERQTLSLLLVTPLGPARIVFEKLLGRLTPMLVFLLLAMPLSAFCYSLGGVSEVHLFGSILILLLTAAQVASLTLFCSTWFGRTITAFLASYVSVLITFLLGGACGLSFVLSPDPNDEAALWAFAVAACMTCAWTALFLYRAATCLEQRAFVVPDYVLNESLRHVDTLRLRRNKKTGDMTLVRNVRALPVDEPIAWRERVKSSMGTVGRRTQLILCLELPLILLVMVGAGLDKWNAPGFIGGLNGIVWGILVLTLIVQSTGLFGRERGRQTLDVLLTTPLSGRETIAQKLEGVWRLLRIFWLPFGTILLYRVLKYVSLRDDHHVEVADVLAVAYTIATVWLLPRLIVWSSLLISLRTSIQSRAILLSILLVVAWCALPPLVLPDWSYSGGPGSEVPAALLISPAVLVAASLSGTAPLDAAVGIFVLYAILCVGLRYVCLSRADRWLGRSGESAPDAAAEDKSPVPRAISQTVPQTTADLQTVIARDQAIHASPLPHGRGTD